jgi:hypothetical protein
MNNKLKINRKEIAMLSDEQIKAFQSETPIDIKAEHGGMIQSFKTKHYKNGKTVVAHAKLVSDHWYGSYTVYVKKVRMKHSKPYGFKFTPDERWKLHCLAPVDIQCECVSRDKEIKYKRKIYQKGCFERDLLEYDTWCILREYVAYIKQATDNLKQDSL